MNDSVPKEIRAPRNGGHRASEGFFSLSVPLPNQSCLYNVERCYGYSKSRGYRYPKKARVTTNYEEDVLRREMKTLTIVDLESSELAVLGNDPNDRKILSRGNNKHEEPEFLSLKFRELDSTIEFLVENRFGFGHENPGVSAYKLARDQNKAYVDNPHFKIGFLRAERYNPKQAARRMLMYLEEKHELFGSEKLTSEIRLEDLGEDGRRFLDIGGIQILPERDKAGRVVFCMADSLKNEEVEEMRRGVRKGYFYMLNCVAEEDDELGKIKGYVAVTWRVHKVQPPDSVALNSIFRLFTCAPIKITAFHLCRPVTTFDIEYLNDYSKMLLPALKNHGIIRFFRSHYGTAQECKYTLLKYGCPNCLPLQEDTKNTGNICPFHVRYHKEWMAKRTEIDCDVRPNDVLLGQTPSLRNHSGNIRLRELVADNFGRYFAPGNSRWQKTTVAEEIGSQIKLGGGRFLKKDEGELWVEANDVEARNKVANAFRSIVKKKKREGTA